MRNHKVGYVDTTGRLVIPLKYQYGMEFSWDWRRFSGTVSTASSGVMEPSISRLERFPNKAKEQSRT
ncbi:MAG TPA: WG repeat-containing protein [Chthonomonadaceae bacterium]|nr:WG repeat-containing protein [Chthonomonadaceae bacterium]